jgi:4a-hydroxytetrahydrobiopterin dehydratase
MPKLSEAEVKAELDKVPDWAEVGGEIQRTFEFKDFREAIAFVNRVAEEAERRQHHPDIMIRYNKVTLALTTHDSGGITEKDFEMASALGDVIGK